MCRKDGVQAAYRNDQRQEYVNNIAYKHGTGLGTAPWYGVPGTAYDLRHAHPAGHTYDTDASRPTGYGYQASVPQYHSQPSYGHGHSGGGGYGKAGKCGGGDDGGYVAEPHSKLAAASSAYRPPAAPSAPAHAGVVAVGKDGNGYSGRQTGANHDKVGYDGMAKHAGYVAGSYEALGYGYMY